MVDISVVVATYNQKERLKLVLVGLDNQTMSQNQCEIIVVDDGSTDDTYAMLQDSRKSNLRVEKLEANRGRCYARNVGAGLARGALVVFLDGDALPHPQLLEAYWRSHRSSQRSSLFQGPHLNLPELEFFVDPQLGELGPWPLSRELADYIRRIRFDLIITEEMIRKNFALVETRALAGGYPGTGVAAMQRDFTDLMLADPQAPGLWPGFVPHNAALPADTLAQLRGFDECIPFSEGAELAYRARQMGIGIRHVPDAKSYHLYHYHDFADRLQRWTRSQAVEYIACKHDDPRVLLLPFLYCHYWTNEIVPEYAIIRGPAAFGEFCTSIDTALLKEYLLIMDTLHESPDLDSLTEVKSIFTSQEGTDTGAVRKVPFSRYTSDAATV